MSWPPPLLAIVISESAVVHIVIGQPLLVPGVLYRLWVLRMAIIGKVTGGKGEGKFFVSLKPYQQGFKEILGFVPFPGTLNVRLRDADVHKIDRMRNHADGIIDGFKMDGRDYFAIRLYKARIRDEEGALIFPHLQHHPLGIAEFVAKNDMRAKYRLKDDDEVEIEVPE